ncbi:Hypothetical_protein [Hexamita inflata]|uniref:Hypothetical_protein n=1 Tax=Hexamita inflata TaxID=28002 RepID=A0AA86NNW5_9EUKA|nr:Hypothetical protein HINF_LOCUS10414 [Hexamita inflata]
MTKARVLVIGVAGNDNNINERRLTSTRFYNSHARIIYHYQAPKSRETDEYFDLVTSQYKIYKHLFTSNGMNYPHQELVEARKQWTAELVDELKSRDYAPNLVLVCSSMEEYIYEKILRRYFNPVISNAYFKDAEFLFIPKQFLTQVISTSYCYFIKNSDKQYFVQYFDDNADIVEFDMSLPTFPPIFTPYKVVKRVIHPYQNIGQLEIVMENVAKYHIDNFTIFQGAQKTKQITLGLELHDQFNLVMLVDGVELKGFEYLQFVTQKSKEFDEAITRENEKAKNKVDLTKKTFKTEKLLAISMAWKKPDKGRVINDWATQLIHGMTNDEIWDKYYEYVHIDIMRKNITGRLM